jgi:hypothetical protein
MARSAREQALACCVHSRVPAQSAQHDRENVHAENEKEQRVHGVVRREGRRGHLAVFGAWSKRIRPSLHDPPNCRAALQRELELELQLQSSQREGSPQAGSEARCEQARERSDDHHPEPGAQVSHGEARRHRREEEEHAGAQVALM